MLTFDTVQSFLAILLLLTVGEIVSRRLKAAIPAILIAGLFYMAGLWSGILPAGLTETAGFTILTPVAMMMIILSMGASTSVRRLLDNWRVVALAAGVFVLQVATLLLVIGTVFGVNTAVAGLPGGSATALIVQERARTLGYDSLVVLSVLLLSTQALAACPIVSLCLKRETRRLLAEGGVETAAASPAPEETAAPGPKSAYQPLLRLLCGAWLAARIEMATGLSRYVVCLLLGVLLGELGFLRRDELERTGGKGFFMLLLMAAVLSGYASATPRMFVEMLLPLVCILLCDIGSIVLFSTLLGRLLGFSPAMSIGIGMNVLVGFPLNFLLTEEVVAMLSDDPSKTRGLTDRISTQMVIGGFTSTTSLAVIAAGLLSGLMR